MCFFLGGLYHHEQKFSTVVASTMSSLMAVATASLIIPAALYSTVDPADPHSFDLILELSRGTSVVLLILYVMYLVFQLWTHADLFTPEAEEHPEGHIEESDESVITVVDASVLLLFVTLAVAICAEYLVGSIDEIVANSGISKTFIGLILIPIVGNAAEHVTAVVVALNDNVCSFCLFRLSSLLHTTPPWEKNVDWARWTVVFPLQPRLTQTHSKSFALTTTCPVNRWTLR